MRSVKINNFNIVIWMELSLPEQDIYIEVCKKTFSLDVNKSRLREEHKVYGCIFVFKEMTCYIEHFE